MYFNCIKFQLFRILYKINYVVIWRMMTILREYYRLYRFTQIITDYTEYVGSFGSIFFSNWSLTKYKKFISDILSVWRLSYRTENCFGHNARTTCFNRTVRFTGLHRLEKRSPRSKEKFFSDAVFTIDTSRHVPRRGGDKKRAISSLCEGSWQSVSQSTKAAIQTTMLR